MHSGIILVVMTADSGFRLRPVQIIWSETFFSHFAASEIRLESGTGVLSPAGLRLNGR